MNYFTRSKKNGDTEDRLVEEPADPWCDPSWRVLQPSYVGIKKLLTFMVAVMFSFGLYAQLNVSKGKVIINFGIDADVHSGVVTYNSFGDAAFGTDDWFQGASGLGVIDETQGNALFQGQANPAGLLPMSVPQFSVVDGRLWVDAIFARDNHWTGNNKDATIFQGSNKNFDNPVSWGATNGSNPQKNDIIDGFGHLRIGRPDMQEMGALWAFFGASTRADNGTSYLDFEFLRNEVTLNGLGSGFVSSGLDDGRTSWHFDPVTQSTSQYGDIIFSTNYTNGGSVVDVRIFIWVHENTDFAAISNYANVPFEFVMSNNTYVFHGDGKLAPNFGYAQIVLKNNSQDVLHAQVNETGIVGIDPMVPAPMWGTISSGGNISNTYTQTTLAEFALNSDAFGFNSGLGGASCGKALGYVVIKTRSSDSFTAELKDFLGPIPFGNIPLGQVDLGDDICNAEGDITLTATTVPNDPSKFTFKWYKDDVEIPGETSYQLVISGDDKSGVYKVEATTQFVPGIPGCTVDDTIVINGSPVCSISGDLEACPEDSKQYSGPVGMASYQWSVEGNASIDGADDQQTVTVTVGEDCLLSFTLTLVVANENGCESSCSLEVFMKEGDFTLPENGSLVIACASELQQPTPPANVVDVCGNSITPSGPVVSQTPDCEGDVSYTWTYEDCRGNSHDWTYTYTIDYQDFADNMPANGSSTVACASEISQPEPPAVTDNCNNPITPVFKGASDLPLCEGDVVYTWTYTDCSGFEHDWTYTYTIDYQDFADNMPANGSSTVACASEISQPEPPAVTDNCNNPITPVFKGASDLPLCEGDVVYTWTYTDCSGFEHDWTYTYTIDYQDFADNMPANGSSTVACASEISQPEPPAVTDNCNNPITPVFKGASDLPLCEGDVVYTWTYTDCSGFEHDWTYTYTIDYQDFADNMPANGSSTVACASEISQPEPPAVTDNCNNPITPVFKGASDLPLCEGDVVYTWTYTDCSGFEHDWTYTYTIDYQDFADNMPANGSSTVACASEISQPEPPAVTDNCNNPITPVFKGASDLPLCEGDVVYTWTYTDCSGFEHDWTYTYTIDYQDFADNMPANGSSTVACASEISQPEPPAVTDNCNNPITPVFKGASDLPLCEGDVVYTWTYTDCSGFEHDWTYTYTIDYQDFADNMPANGSSTVACASEISQPEPPAVTDNCNNPITPVFKGASDLPLCEGDVVYTWTYTDCSGFEHDWTYTYTIDYQDFADNMPANGSSTVACASEISQPEPPAVTDNCNNPITPVFKGASDLPLCEGDVVYTWTYTDCSGFEHDWTYTYTIDYQDFADNMPANGSSTVACASEISQPEPPAVTDNCNNPITPVFKGASDLPLCEGDVVYTWTYTDCSGFEHDWTYTYTIDYQDFADNMPANGSSTVACASEISQPEPPAVTDNCNNPITPVFKGASDLPLCEGDVVYTWTYTDCSGFEHDWTYTYTIDYQDFADNMPANGSSTVACASEISQPEPPAVTDNCNNPITPVFKGASDLPLCEGDVVYTWTYTDCSGFEHDWTYTYTIDYQDFADNMPANGSSTVACASEISQPEPPAVTDNCNNPITPVFKGASDLPLCEGDVVYTWTYTDCSGFEHDWTYTYTIDYQDFADNMPANGSSTVACASEISQPEPPAVTDNCNNPITPVFKGASDLPLCEGDVVYTWTYTDCSGFEHDWTYTYTIDYQDFADNMPANGSSTVACASEISQPEPPAVSDNCNNPITPVFKGASDLPLCEGDVVYTWTYTDCSGFEHDWTYTYTIDYQDFADNMPANGSSTVACASEISQPEPPAVTDNCNNPITPVFKGASDLPLCEGDVVYTWTYTDCSGFEHDWTYTYTIDYQDFADNMPANGSSTVACASEISQPEPPAVTDNCNNPITPVFKGASDLPLCEGDVVYTWTYTDCSGFEHDWTYTYTLKDDVPPVITLPTYDDYICNGEVPVMLTATWVDNCGGEGTSDAYAELVGEDDCTKTYKYTFVATDACFNEAKEEIFIVQEIEQMECETVFAYYDDEMSTCFLDMPEIKNSRWGWTNYITEPGEYVLSLYAGAADCDTNKGVYSGTATISYDGSQVTVMYDMVEGFVLSAAHVYVGCEPYPMSKNGDPIIAPGQYPFSPNLGGNVDTYTVGPINVTGDFYVIVHGVACEVICACSGDDIISGDNGGQSFEGGSIECDDSSEEVIVMPTEQTASADFNVYPVPFKDVLNVQYKFNYKSDVTIEVFDMRGVLVKTVKDQQAYPGKVMSMPVDFKYAAEQVYFIKISTKKGSYIKKVISAKF